MELPPTVGDTYPKNVMVESHRGSLEDLQSEKIPFAVNVQFFGRRISKLSSVLPNEGMPWIIESDLATSIDNLETSQFFTGVYQNYETLHWRIAIVLK